MPSGRKPKSIFQYFLNMNNCSCFLCRRFTKCCFPSVSLSIFSYQERVIETLREQKERDDRARLEELEQMRRENQELKDKLSALQPQKLSQSQLANPGLTQNQRPDKEVSTDILMLWYIQRWCCVNDRKGCVYIVCVCVCVLVLFVNMFRLYCIAIISYIFHLFWNILKKLMVETERVCRLIWTQQLRTACVVCVWMANSPEFFIVIHIIQELHMLQHRVLKWAHTQNIIS